ncbi:hypothetical protein ABZ614_17030 [Streptomyces sp. NPDC013178]|uniref:hypothetical protein n=1 Tax=Streptomyces sp. NPDC013178 TaxID=3155118 RepID=UPI0033FCABB1
MPADEVTTGSDVDAARVRTGPRHAAPKKPLFTRLHMPAGKAIALAAMPTAVLMGMGFTPTLANAEDQPSSKNLTVDEYKDCVAALEGEEDASASPSPSASESTSADEDKADEDKTGSKDESKDDSGDGSSDSSGGKGTSGDSSSDSGSGDGAEPAPSASSPASAPEKSASSSGGDTPTASPSPSETDKNVLETIGDTLTDLFDGKDSGATASASPSPSASESASTGTGGDTSSGSGSGSGSSGSGKDDSGTAKDTTDAVSDAVKDTAEKAEKATEDTTEKAEEAAADASDATASPSPSASASTDPDDCPAATDDESGVDNKVPLADDPWYLDASSLLLKDADYQGVVEVKTANGTKKKVLKYVISGGTDIGDLHQTVKDKQSGVTYHVQAGSGTTSTIRNGVTTMYTESISGNLFGLIPVTFSPENPPPLNIPLIYFTKVKVVQAGQFGGDLHIPGMHVYNTK